VADRSPLGEIIRSQRELNALSMRQFAKMVGISNPYLSQIERGLREPSEKVVDAIARSLETSADALYQQAGIVADAVNDECAVIDAINADPGLSATQRKALIQVYESFAGTQHSRRRRRSRVSAGEPG
jgi:transcriptional regulator with XRE-family HTH domain